MYLEQISPRREFHNAGIGFRYCPVFDNHPETFMQPTRLKTWDMS